MLLDTEIFFQESGVEIEAFSDPCIFLSNGFMLERLDCNKGLDNYSLYLGIDHTTRVYWPSNANGHDRIDGPVCLINGLDAYSYKRETNLNEILNFLRLLPEGPQTSDNFLANF